MVNDQLDSRVLEELDLFALIKSVDKFSTDLGVLVDVLHIYELHIHRLQRTA